MLNEILLTILLIFLIFHTYFLFKDLYKQAGLKSPAFNMKLSGGKKGSVISSMPTNEEAQTERLKKKLPKVAFTANLNDLNEHFGED